MRNPKRYGKEKTSDEQVRYKIFGMDKKQRYQPNGRKHAIALDGEETEAHIRNKHRGNDLRFDNAKAHRSPVTRQRACRNRTREAEQAANKDLAPQSATSKTVASKFVRPSRRPLCKVASSR